MKNYGKTHKTKTNQEKTLWQCTCNILGKSKFINKMTTNYFVPASLLSIVSPNFASELFCYKMKFLKKTSSIRVYIIGMS